MQDMVAHLSNCLPINTITVLDSEVGRELTRPWSFSCNGRAQIDYFLDNAGLQPSGEIDVRGVAMPWDVDLSLAGGQLIAQVYKFRWDVQLDTVTIQPMKMFRKLRRAVAGELIITLEEYVVSDGPESNGLLARSANVYLGMLGGQDAAGQQVAPPSYDFDITVHFDPFAATS